MATIVREPQDPAVAALKRALDEYEQAHHGAIASLYRQNSASVRIRIIDDRFAAMPKSQRHDLVWDYLSSRLDDDTLQEISVLLLLSPKEQASSLMNMEFDHPLPSDF
jgi:stress-induced morphogen